MKEFNEILRTTFNVFDSNGEIFEVNGATEKSSKYYSIENLNKRISVMDLFTYQSKLCNSSKDILMFRDFLMKVDKHNEFRENISSFCKKHDIDRSRITKFLTNAVKIGLVLRINRGVYLVNPLVFQSRGSNNEFIEEAQRTWMKLIKNHR